MLFIDIDLNCDPSCIHTMTVKSLEELKIMLYFFLIVSVPSLKFIKVDSIFDEIIVK